MRRWRDGGPDERKPVLVSVFFGFAINLLTAETGGWWGPLQPLTRFPWIWVPVCVLVWFCWETWSRRRRRPTWTATDSPYPGLAAFDASRAAVFYGRDRDIQEILTRLDRSGAEATQRLIMLAGPSGSGKSSLIRAGVMPRLPKRWRCYGPIRAGADPFGALAMALYPGGDRAHTVERLRADSRREGRPDYLAALIHPETGPVLLVIDQWEDLYDRGADAERLLFLQLLHAALTAYPDLHLLAAVRPDCYARVEAEQVLRVSDPIPVATLRPDQVREAIEKPAAAAGITFDEGLVNTMVIESTAHEADILPLLGHLLQQLHHEARDNLVTTEQYDAAGRVSGAIARHADAVHRSLTLQIDQPTVDRVLLRGAGIEGDRVVRRPIPHTGLDEQARRVLTAFRDARIIVDTDHGAAFEFAHEAVIREWPTLATLIDTHRDRLRRITLLEQTAAAWETGGHDDDLLRGTALDAAQHLSTETEASPAVQRYLAASQATSTQDLDRRADRAAEWAQQLEPSDPELALAVATAAVTELAATDAAVLTLWGLRAEPTVAHLPIGHTTGISAVGWLADGSLRSLDRSGRVCTWQAGQPPTETTLSSPALTDHTVLSRCGRYVFGRTERGGVGVWRLDDGRYVGGRALSWVSAVAWGRDAMFALSAGSGSVDIYTMGESGPVHCHTIETTRVDALAFTPSGTHLGIAGDRRVRIFDVDNEWQPTTDIRIRAETFEDLAIAPGGSCLAVLYQRSSDHLRKALTLAVYVGGTTAIKPWPIGRLGSPIAWSPDGTTLAYVNSTGDDQIVELRRPADGPHVSHRHHGKALPEQLVWSPDGTSIAMCGLTSGLAVWSPAENTVSDLSSGSTADISWSCDRSRAAVTRTGRRVRVLRASGQLLHELPDGYESRHARWSPTGLLLAVGERNRITVFGGDGEPVICFGERDTTLGTFAWSPDGSRMALSHHDFWEIEPTVVSVWDTRTGALLRVMTGQPGPRLLAFCPDGRLLAGTTKDGGPIVWDSTTGDIVGHCTIPDTTSALGWSPDGRTLAAVMDQHVGLWDPRSSTETARYIGHRSMVEGLCWSPDSVHVASVDRDRLVIWRAGDARPLTAIRRTTRETICDIAWTTELTLTLADGTQLSWAVPFDEPNADTKEADSRPLSADERHRYGLPTAVTFRPA
jgi:WD40 repeat protein